MKSTVGVLVYVRQKGCFLMLHRNKRNEDMHKGFWVAPGGKREKNESIPDCARRELYEETGLTALELKFLGFLHFPDTGASPFEGEWVDFVFLCTRFEGQVKKNIPEGALEWIPARDLCSLPMWAGDRIFTPYVIRGKRFEASLTYEQGTLISYFIKDIN
ncbi:MAG TPA: 8-oxo-dGTP diphosphatase [Firmicutes bacterium]|nr:8-oxo-dGTP diphosphatase [Bacillota bacterium]